MKIVEYVQTHAVPVKDALDVGAVGIFATAVFTEFLPYTSTLFTTIWFVLRVWEMKSVQKLVKKLRNKKDGS